MKFLRLFLLFSISVFNYSVSQNQERIFTAADLPIVDGKVYHLSLSADQLAPNIIIVGDPGRVPLLANHCLKKENRIHVFHRGLRTITGKTKNGIPVSIITSGMGTPSTEIVINEIIALNEIDLHTRKKRETPLHKNLNIIRLGTSGGLQEDRVLGSFIITKYAIGLDNSGLFYESKHTDERIIELEQITKQKLDEATDKESRFYGTIRPYAAAASSEVVQALYEASIEQNAPVIKGITISNSGFFANQGRDISRVALTIPNIDKVCSEIAIDDVQVENMEMEASFLCHFVGGLGYQVGAICLTVAHRTLNTFFSGDCEQKIIDMLDIVIRAFEKLQ